MTKPFLLIILDGLGLGESCETNAFYMANTPHLDRLMRDHTATLLTSGEEVGLPQGQMGNSEVGHLNIGAGRIVDQDLNRITKSFHQGTFRDLPEARSILEAAREKNTIHLMGLLSKGGVHSHMDHLKGLIQWAQEGGIENIYVHGITDGRDVAPQEALEDVRTLMRFMEEQGAGELVSLIGRFYAMDRDKRWDRTAVAYDLFTYGSGIGTENLEIALEGAYRMGMSDEFLKPFVKMERGLPKGRIQNGETLLFYNFRPDRARQIIHSYADVDFDGFLRYENPALTIGTMTNYDRSMENVQVLFDKEDIHNSLGEVVAEAGLKQLRIAETEKYPHVTFFFNGGREEPFLGEERILVDSPKVATYDLKPEMSAYEVTEKLLANMENYDFIVLNYANPDMVGHTGILSKAMEAVETVDICLGEVLKKLDELEGRAIIIADHGNCEVMEEPNGSPRTSHSTNPVPLITYHIDETLENGVLADIAPTILDLMQLEKPVEMTGKSLVRRLI